MTRDDARQHPADGLAGRVRAKAAAVSALVLTCGLGACTQTWIVSDDRDAPSDSTVEYQPVARAPGKGSTAGSDRPAAPPARLPQGVATVLAERRATVERSPSGSIVRYEPIRRESPRQAPATTIPARVEAEVRDALPPEREWHDEDAQSDPAQPHPLDATEHALAPGDSEELPLEDRKVRPKPRAGVREVAEPGLYNVRLNEDGVAFPYPTQHFFRGFGPCRGGRGHSHEAIDLGGVGPDWGIGTPIRSMAKAEVVFIGTGDMNPDDFGTPDMRDGEALRGDKMLPRWKDIEPYGRVYFFTRKKGRWRSGNLVVTRVLEGPLAGHVVRYLHIAAVHPDVKVGSVVELGQEIALMGGTGVQESAPHLHLDIQGPDGRRLDVAPMLGLAPTASCKTQPREMPKASVREARVSADLDDAPTTRSRLTEPSTDQVDDEAAESDAQNNEGEREPAREAKPLARVEAKPEPRADAKPERKAEPEREAKPERKAEPRSEPRDGKKLELKRLVVPKCKGLARQDDFSSGRYDAHTVAVGVSKGSKVTVEIERLRGTWKPRLTVSGDDVTVKPLVTGKIGKKAVASLDVKDDQVLTVEIGGWGDIPDDAAYALRFTDKCKRR
ncbi:MAG: peptidoglycan DD-metalloendopeptidase family protein [Deltaproteobacteria bacterium]|nr:peptidoglycan DD-metalloendopeptidase family protein [Deltaproteobacteria bacterium]